MISKKIERYTDYILERNEEQKFYLPPPDLISAQDIRKLELMDLQMETDQFFEKLLHLKNKKSDKEIEQICYTEIGRKMVKVQQKQIRREFQKTNIYIRAYLLRSIYEYVTKLASNSKNTIYILPNVKGLHFSTEKKPEELQKYLQDSQYVEIIKNINYIIQNGLFLNKKRQKKINVLRLTAIFLSILIFVMTLLIICVWSSETWSHQSIEILIILIGLLFAVIMIAILGYSMHSFHSEIQFKPLCQKIMQEIQEYFTYINTKYQNKVQWMIGQSFFWIQVKIDQEQDEEGSSGHESSQVSQK